ncbi:protein LOL3-like isoform X2 [Andrographis paniculata]|uniref:protein LOL3-like isoform X2 n=1 Tax=Andrographis paniculata TaxID=175694 RepID=UPI0021E7ED9C|nr:protein LOL3-like isoform X2 [Andrographis paniculata]
MQSQIFCSGCRTLLLRPSGPANICCVLCNVMTHVPPALAEVEVTQSICGGCHMIIAHTPGETIVRCSCCQTLNFVQAPSAPAPNNVGHINCPSCHTMLIYPAGVPFVKCAVCSFITNIVDSMLPTPLNAPAGGTMHSSMPSTSSGSGYYESHTVVVQNPTTVDENGNLVRNVVVGVQHSNMEEWVQQ